MYRQEKCLIAVLSVAYEKAPSKLSNMDYSPSLCVTMLLFKIENY